MALNNAQSRRAATALAKLTLGALVINALAYASKFVLLGQFDREIGIWLDV